MNYLAIGLVIIIIVILYYVYYYFTNTTLTSGLQELNTPTSVKYNLLKNPGAFTYSYQCWLYISSPTSGSVPIFYRKKGNGPGSNSEFEVNLNGQLLKLKAGNGSSAPPNDIMTITDSFPIQKWTYLVINVYNLKTYEAYINGKLAKTVNVPNANAQTPTYHTSGLYIGDSTLNGYVTKFIRLPSTLEAKTVWEIYLSGNGLSSFFTSLIPYGMNMSISKGEDLQRVVQIF